MLIIVRMILLFDSQKAYLCNMKIYIVNGIDSFDETLIENCLSFFPQWRKDKMLNYRFLKGRIQCALAYLLLIHALREEGVFDEMPEFFYGEHQKPFLKNYPGWHFNLSHCKNAVCCVLSRREVGIDIEEIKEYNPWQTLNCRIYISYENRTSPIICQTTQELEAWLDSAYKQIEEIKVLF